MPPWVAIILIVVGILILALVMAALSGLRNGPMKNARQAAGLTDRDDTRKSG